MGEADGWDAQRRMPPPEGPQARPAVDTVPAGKRLWRIHRQDTAALAFSTRIPTALTGGRFDCTDDSWGVLYAADSFEGAVAETILRTTPLVDVGERVVPFAQVRGRVVSVLELPRDLRVASLHGADAAAVGQGPWLTKCDAVDYPLTRMWARAIHDCDESLDGLVWRARFDEDRLSYAIWSDRCSDLPAAVTTIPIDSGEGLEGVRRVLLDHSAVIEG